MLPSRSLSDLTSFVVPQEHKHNQQDGTFLVPSCRAISLTAVSLVKTSPGSILLLGFRDFCLGWLSMLMRTTLTIAAPILLVVEEGC